MKLDDIKTVHFFPLEKDDLFFELFTHSIYPWDLLDKIGSFVKSLGATLSTSDYDKIGDDIWIEKTANVSEFSTIKGPTIIEAGAQLRPGSFIRGNAYVGEGSVVGTATELKNVLLLGHVEVPHYNYIGDSILSYGAHMGAGSITSNLRADKQNIIVRYEGEEIETGLRKFGAMVARSAEVGCNAVLNPGVLIGERSIVYPLSCVRISVPACHIYKQTGEMVKNRNYND